MNILVKDISEFGINATDFDPVLMEYAPEIKDFGVVTLEVLRDVAMTSATK